MAIISRLPQGGGSGGGFVFNIVTTESSLFGQDVTITGPEPTKTVPLSAEGKATVKAKKAGTYTFTCGKAVFSKDYTLYGEFTVELTLYDAVITVTGAVSLAPTMDSRYIVPDGYYKPNNVDGMQVSLYDGASQIAIPQAFSGGSDTVTFTVDTRVHTNVTVKFSDEGAKGFTNPADVPLTLEKGKPASASGTWVEKYARLEVQTTDPELLDYNVVLSWGDTPDKQITWQTDKVSDKSEFIVKSATTYTATCGEATPQTRNVYSSDLDGRTLTPPLNIAIQRKFYLYDGTRSIDQECTDNGTGGWSNSGYSLESQNYSVAPTKTSNGFKCNGGNTNIKGWGTVNAIPFLSKYKKVCVSIKGLSKSSNFYYRVIINESKAIDSLSNVTVWYEMSKTTDVGTNEYTFDNSKLSGNYYVSFEYNHGDTSNYVEVESIWLE